MVFIDDSKFERHQMKKFNPEVNVLEFPSSPLEIVNTIENSCFFNQLNNLTTEDKKKNNQYKIISKANRFKLNYKNSTAGVEKYINNLKIKLFIEPINKINFNRCVQMLNKTNQFNLTTEDSETTFNNYVNNNKVFSFVVRVKDRFGDHGITALLIMEKVEKIS